MAYPPWPGITFTKSFLTLTTQNFKAMITTEKKLASVGQFVDTAHVDTVIREYKQERWVHNSERIGKEDSLSTWYTLEEMENWLATAKANGADGIRMYFAAYPSNFQKEPLYADRQTIVMVATKEKQTATGIANKDIYVNTENGTSILAYNMGKVCPPFCGSGTTKPGEGGFDDGEWGIGMTIVDRGDKGLAVI
jgi:hypothetical protein